MIKLQRVRHISTAAIVSCLLLLLESCNLSVKPEYIADDKQLAEREIDKFHLRFNAGNFETIWNQASITLKKALSKKDFITFLSNGHQQCGDFKRIIDKRINVIIQPSPQVRVMYNSQ